VRHELNTICHNGQIGCLQNVQRMPKLSAKNVKIITAECMVNHPALPSAYRTHVAIPHKITRILPPIVMASLLRNETVNALRRTFSSVLRFNRFHLFLKPKN